MYPVLIGSRALNYWYPERKISPSTDWDVISFKQHEGCEVHDPLFLNNQAMMGYHSSQTIRLPDGDLAYVMSSLGLALIKRSHLWRDLAFQKHITDFHKFHLCSKLRFLTEEAKHPRVARDLQERIRMTKEAFPQGHPNLMQPVEDFFDDYVTKKYSHDWLHELFAFDGKPMYTKMQRDPSKAWCEKDMWDQFTHQEKIWCIAEEVQVIATERFLVPQDFDFPYKLAYLKSLDKVCTTLCSGWFRDYAIDFYPEVLKTYQPERFECVKMILAKK